MSFLEISRRNRVPVKIKGFSPFWA